jgi:ferric-dicitrate binding protein FerR (iron transport regulator)
MKEPRWLEDSEKAAHQVLRRSLDETPHWVHSEVRQRRLWTRVADAANSVRATRRAFRTGALAASALTVLFVGALELGRWQFGNDDAPTTTAGVAVATPRPPAVVPSGDEGTSTPPSEVIETSANERRIRDLRQSARAEIQPSSVLALDDLGRPSVRKGQVRFQVAHQPPGQRFSVRFGGYVAVVVGTRFVVNVHDAKLALSVEEGTVEIWRGDARVARVTRGQSWSSGEPGVVETLVRARPHAAIATEPALAAARAETDPHRALGLYNVLAQGKGPCAENALYEMAAIYQDKLGQPRDALATWQRYRARFPSGLLRIEADLSIVDTLASLGDNRGALSEASAFLRRYPQTERRGEVARVAGDLARAHGDCRAAVDFYSLVLASQPDASDADDAAFGRADCLHTQGAATASEALRGYLSQHPRGRHSGEARRLAAEF